MEKERRIKRKKNEGRERMRKRKIIKSSKIGEFDTCQNTDTFGSKT